MFVAAPKLLSTVEGADGSAQRRIVSTACWVAVVAVIVQSAAHLGNFAFDADVEALNADEEHNAFAWASAVSTFAAAFFLFVPAVAAGALDRITAALSGAIAFLSLDDALSLHERFAERSVEVLELEFSLQRVVWPVVYLPLLAFVFLILLRIARASARSVAAALQVGLLLLAAAIVAEITSALYIGEGDEGTWPNALEVTFEEGAELAGWILIAAALAARADLLRGSRT